MILKKSKDLLASLFGIGTEKLRSLSLSPVEMVGLISSLLVKVL